MPNTVPTGFQRLSHEGPLGVAGSWFDLVGPIYGQPNPEAGRSRIGFFAEEKHKNYLRQTHGGMLAAFMDYVLFFAADSRSEGAGLVTVNLNVNYLAAAPIGVWVDGEGEVLREGRQIVFVQGVARAEGKTLVQATAAFRKIARAT